MDVNKQFINSIVITFANIQNIPPCEVTYLYFEDENKDVAGYFIPDRYLININLDIVEKFSDLELTAFLIHEMRHAYQYMQVKGIGKSIEQKEVINKWKEEINQYFFPVNNEKYLMQSIEIDAVAFTSYVCLNLLNQKLLIPDLIKNEVMKRMEEITKVYNL